MPGVEVDSVSVDVVVAFQLKHVFSEKLLLFEIYLLFDNQPVHKDNLHMYRLKKHSPQ